MESPVLDLAINLEYEDFPDIVDKPKQFYKPGDYIKGSVILTLRRDLRIRGVFLHVTGQGQTAWEGRGRGKTFEESEMYLDHLEPLVRPAMTDYYFPRGCHRFAFRSQLPYTLPSSFKGTYGTVTYVAKAAMEAEDQLYDAIVKVPFTVLRRDPIPEIAYRPLDLNKSKTFMGLQVGKVKVNCSLDHAIAVPGETIGVNALVRNWSGKDLTLIQGGIIMESTFRAQGKHVQFRDFISKRQDFFDINVQWGRRWNDVKIDVPPYLADSGLLACNIIDVQYIFQFRVQVNGEEDIVLEAPLFVGYHQDGYVLPGPKAMLMRRMLDDGARQRMMPFYN